MLKGARGTEGRGATGAEARGRWGAGARGATEHGRNVLCVSGLGHVFPQLGASRRGSVCSAELLLRRCGVSSGSHGRACSDEIHTRRTWIIWPPGKRQLPLVCALHSPPRGSRGLPPPNPRFPLRSASPTEGLLPQATKRDIAWC